MSNQVGKARSLIDQYLHMSRSDVALAVHKAVIRKYKSQIYGAYLKHQNVLVDFLAGAGKELDFGEVYETSRKRLMKSCLVWPYREKRDLTKSMLKAYGLGGKRALIKQDEEFDDFITDASEAWAREEAAAHIVGISASAQEKIKKVIAQAVSEGWGIPEVKKALMPLIGLDEARLATLGNYELEQIERGFSGSALQARLDTFELRLIRQRAETIARTETAAASSEGTLTAFDDMGIAEVEGVSDPECCPDCDAEINGKTFTIEEAREMIPYHPNCECTWVAL